MIYANVRSHHSYLLTTTNVFLPPSLFFVRIIYDYCVKGQDLNIWYVQTTENPNTNGKSRTEEMTILINEFLDKYLKEEVSKVKL